ncbi:MAG: glycosyltransferase family 4 protein [Proteobacteria bacterium]|nr:glycosyltransferase family 4 protein [Pseudomonadota bacterium]
MWIELGIAMSIAALVSVLACMVLVRRGPLDHPDVARKAHKLPTPTSGGLGIAAGFLAGFLALLAIFPAWGDTLFEENVTLKAAIVLFAFIFLFLGFIDDATPISPRLKFLIFTAAAFAAAWRVGVVNQLPLGDGNALYLPLFVGAVGTALWVFTLINSVNFMDGSNGLAMGSTAIGLSALGAIALQLGSPSSGAICFSAVGAIIGFLFWNFPKGRLFAGDAGALFVGAIAALTSLYIIRRTQLSPLIPPILFFPLLADALLTLLWRARRRRSLLDAHAEHLYQIAHRAGWSHLRVAFSYWIAMALCGAVGFAAALSPQSAFAPIGLAVLAAAAIVVAQIVRRYAVKRGIAEI